MNGAHGQNDNPRGYEHSDVKARGIFIFFAALFGILLILMLALVLFFRLLAGPMERTGFFDRRPESLPPPPIIQVHPEAGLRALREQEEKTLTTYGWAEKGQNRVRIPIQRAMEILAQRGLPSRPLSETNPQTPKDRGKDESR